MSTAATPASRTAADQVAWAAAALASVSDSARLEAELLFAETAGIGRAAVIAHPERSLSVEQASRLESIVSRRSRGEPLAYILGQKEFYSLSLTVCPDVLVPRPETETLVDAVLARLPDPSASVLDLGTGSGAIALALKYQRPDFDITAVDCEESVLAVARANAVALDLEIDWLLSDWFGALQGLRFDAIVSNPPYVPSGDPHFDRGLAHEPRVALDGGKDGLDAYRVILRDAKQYLAPGGWLMFEHGFDQREALVSLAAESGFRLDAAIDDLASLPRVAFFREASA